MTVLWPQVKDRLVTIARSLPEYAAVEVFNGPAPAGLNPAQYLTVGWQPSQESDSAGVFEQQAGPDGWRITETGAVLCELGVSTGDPEVPSAFGLYDALAAHIQADPRLGLLQPPATSSLSAEVAQVQDQTGAAQRLLLTFTYTARA